MSDYNSGYSSGYSSGHSDGVAEGREEAFAEVDKLEATTLAGIIAANPGFYKGMKDAQAYLADAYEVSDLDDYVDEKAVEISHRSWKTLWLKKREASDKDERQIEGDAQRMISRHFLAAAGDISGDDMFETARYCAGEINETLGIVFDTGTAAAFAMKLTEEDCYRYGFTGRLHKVTASIKGLDAKALIEGDEQARNENIDHYADFLRKALEQTGTQVATHLEANIGKAFEDYSKKAAPQPQ